MVHRRREGKRVGIDTGGTFTDLVLLGRGGARVLKVPSMPHDPSQAVIRGLSELGLLKERIPVIHGTTVATNAFLQRRGGRTALVTTSGFEDVLALGRQARPHLYRLDPPPRKVWVPDRLRIGLVERRGPGGEERVALRSGSLARLRRRLLRLRIDAVAVCLLHAYADPRNERAVARALRGTPWHLSLSHRVANEFREYERTCTTVANASLAGPVTRYLTRLGRILGRNRLRIMTSSAGWISPRRATTYPVRTVLSGPAGGALAAALLGRSAGHPRLITLDMGGTSTDISLCEGEVARVHATELDGVPLRIPALDIRSVGAGGGSIARIDPGGALRVGPDSAGADPGPACYSRGGTNPTLTDAHLLLGHLPPEGLLGGRIPLDPRPSGEALERLGRRVGMSRQEAAKGILQVTDASLERAIRALATGRGKDPAGFTLLVFGGAGGLHACSLASALNMQTILIPPDPGAFSALGLACSPAVYEASRSVLLRGVRLSEKEIAALLAPLEREGFRTLAREGHAASTLVCERLADLRYKGQSHELTLPVQPRLHETFHLAHASQFGYARPGEEIELVTLRIRVTAPAPLRRLRRRHRPSPTGSAPPANSRRSADTGSYHTIPRYRREDLADDIALEGPALITEYSATTYLPPGFHLQVDPLGNLILRSQAPGRK